ncbi:unnamed protein product [Lactuca virosa]|uniref:Uncharacterized protein n=1 Tax=Lactuca virosa TaxID=75947 RepID=A0AAU9PK20_9ASTR|nr:unnamed protein product [Lactuca virosa]
MEKVLNTLIQQFNKTRESLKGVQLKIINHCDTKEDIIQNIPTTPCYMNYIVSTKVLQDAKKADADMLDIISNMQETMEKTIIAYKNMIKHLLDD